MDQRHGLGWITNIQGIIKIFFVHFMIKILTWFTLFYLAIADCGKLRENSCAKKTKKTLFNTFLQQAFLW